jgi:gliding motility-associated-like protein
MAKKYNSFLRKFLFFIFLSILPTTIYAQCAGEDNKFEVCDIPNASSQTISLFSKLLGSPVTGGVWTDDDNTGGLNTTTGVLNAQLITDSGIFHYTYTVPKVGGCTDNSATIEVTVGGYSGVTSPNVTVCSADINFNLFKAFNGTYLSPQSNGQWHNDTTNQFVGSSVNVEHLEGNFQFTYTMPAIGTCPAMSSTAIITVKRAPEAGLAQDLPLCASNGLSAYTNYDLFSSISGQDIGGTWIDSNNSGELTFTGDHNIDIEKIYNRFGDGVFRFIYRVPSTNPICPADQTTVVIRLEEKLDFTGATVVVNSDICETEIPTATYSVTITKGPALIPNGSYFVTFHVSGPKAATEVITANFTNGVLIFPIKSEYFQQVGSFKVDIINIVSVTSVQACKNIINNLSDDLNIYRIPNLEGAKIDQVTTCQNEDALVVISNAVKLDDGVFDILYNISGANTAFSQTARITSVGGTSSFIVPGILNSKSGTSVVTITAITHVISQCTNTANLKGDILISPLPNTVTLTIQIPNVCFGATVPASISGLGTLTDATLSYILSGANTSTLQTIVLTPTRGNANFTIPAALLLNTGTTTATVTYLKNNITGCGDVVTGLSDPFILSPIPVAPVVAENQPFCKVANATIATLQPSGTQYKWYISETSTTALANTYVLQSESYYVRETSTAGCTSESSMTTVTINDSPAPLLNDPADFCGLNNPTILDLSNKTNSPSTVVWYDAASNGNVLPPSTPLVDKRIYYAFDLAADTNCLSEENTPVTVSLIDCNSPEYPFFIPDGFSPNGDGVNDTFTIPDIDFLYPNYKLEIFNRYGNGMYKGFKNKPAWDGINYEQSGIGGGTAPNGVYFYILYFNKDNKPPQQGRLYLNR